MVTHRAFPIRGYSLGSARFGDSYENQINQKVYQLYQNIQA